MPNASCHQHALFSDLKHAIIKLGLTKPDTRGTVLRLILWSPLHIALWLFAWTSSNPGLAFATAIAISVLQAQFAFIGHDASHGTAARGSWGNRLVGKLTMGVVGGLCFQEWQHRHLLHHKHCQDETRDPDMQFGTAFSLSTTSRDQKTGLGRLLAPYQAWYFWPSTLLFAFSLRASSLLGALREPRRYATDILSVLAHFALWLIVPLVALQADPSRVVWVYVVSSCFLGLRLATVFTVNHVGMPERVHEDSHFEHQLATSRNVKNPRWLDWYFGGLNFQIEHHLFPICPRRRLRQTAGVVRPSIAKTPLRYHETTWMEAACEVTRHMHAVSHAATPAAEA